MLLFGSNSKRAYIARMHLKITDCCAQIMTNPSPGQKCFFPPTLLQSVDYVFSYKLTSSAKQKRSKLERGPIHWHTSISLKAFRHFLQFKLSFMETLDRRGNKGWRRRRGISLQIEFLEWHGYIVL